MHSVIREQFKALASRLQVPGKESVQMSGAITDGSGNCASQVLIGLGSKVRIDLSRSLRSDDGS